MKGFFKKVTGIKTYQYIVMQIQEAIEQGLLKYGDKLPSEFELANQFGVSRSSVREALLILEFMGIVETKKGSGTEISDPTRDNIVHRLSQFIGDSNDFILHLFEVRKIIETQAAKLAAERGSEEDFSKMAGVLRIWPCCLKSKCRSLTKRQSFIS